MPAERTAISTLLFRDNPHAISDYLTDKFKENNAAEVSPALAMVMRAQNVQILARDAGLRRDALYRTFGGRIDPQIGRVLRLFQGLNVEPRIVPITQGSSEIATRLDETLSFSEPLQAIQALSAIVKSQNVSTLAAKLGILRTTVYKTFGGTVDPQMSRVLTLFKALELRLAVEPAAPRIRPPRPKLGRPPKIPI